MEHAGDDGLHLFEVINLLHDSINQLHGLSRTNFRKILPGLRKIG